jgi:hypothetical protein
MMSNPLSNFQEYFREIEAEMEALKAAVLAKEEAARPQPPSAEASTIGEIPVMHFQGPVEPFTLTVRQLETVRACWSDVQGFLWVNAGTPKPSQAQPAPANQAARPPRTRETREARGWATERAAALGVSPIPNPNAFPKEAVEGSGEAPETTSEEEADNTYVPAVIANQETGREELPMRERPNYGVSRIDQPEKANHGWYIRITKNGHTEQKFFADKSYGGKAPALEHAREFRDLLKEQILGIPRSTPPVSIPKPAPAPPFWSNISQNEPNLHVQFEPPADEDEFKI